MSEMTRPYRGSSLWVGAVVLSALPLVTSAGAVESSAQSINGSDALSINGSDALSINGSDVLSINGSDALSINGSDVLSINGSDALSINGSDALSINGSDALSINGSDALSINGSDALSINGSDVLFAAVDNVTASYVDLSPYVSRAGAFAIGIQPSLLAVAPIESLDAARSVVAVVGGEVAVTGRDLNALAEGDLVAVFGAMTSSGFSVATSLAKLSDVAPSSRTDVFVQGTVGAVNANLGLITVGGVSFDYTPLMSRSALPSVGERVALVGTKYAGSSVVVAK